MTVTSRSTATPDLPTSRPRRVALATLAALYVVGAGLASWGIPSLLTAWTTSGGELALRTHYLLWGLLAGLLIPAAALPLVWRPRTAQIQQLSTLVAASMVGAVLAFEPENIRYLAIFAAPALLLVLLSPARRDLFRAGSWHFPMLGVAAMSSVPALVYAVENLRLSAETAATAELHGGYAHAGVVAIALAGSAVVAARRAAGWRWVAGSTVAGTVLLGLAGLLFPDDPSSLGTAGGVAALLLAGAFLAAALRGASAAPPATARERGPRCAPVPQAFARRTSDPRSPVPRSR